jgi:hypothetical protein
MEIRAPAPEARKTRPSQSVALVHQRPVYSRPELADRMLSAVPQKPSAMLTPMEPTEKVRYELKKYVHPLLDFSVREQNGRVELVINLKNKPPDIHTYYLEIHPRDLENTQFPWTLQRMIFDGLHDYFIEMFVYTPQSLDNPDAPR